MSEVTDLIFSLKYLLFRVRVYQRLGGGMSQDESKMLCENNKGYAIDA